MTLCRGRGSSLLAAEVRRPRGRLQRRSLVLQSLMLPFFLAAGHGALLGREERRRFFSVGFHPWVCVASIKGILLKRSGSSLNKEWKKKYVTLSNDGILSYHASVNVSRRVDGHGRKRGLGAGR